MFLSFQFEIIQTLYAMVVNTMVPSEIAMNAMKSASQLNLLTTQTAIGIAETMTPFGTSVTDLALQVRNYGKV